MLLRLFDAAMLLDDTYAPARYSYAAMALRERAN